VDAGVVVPDGSLRVGDAEVIAVTDEIREGPWTLAEAFPDVPPEQWPGIAERYPETFAGDAWRAHDRCFVIRTTDRTILVDTGIGPAGTPVADLLHPEGGALLDELRDAGVSPSDVDVVVLTHMHFDHIGWNVSGPAEDPRPTFPRATYLLQSAEWDTYSVGDEDPQGSPARDRQVRWLREAGVLELVDGEREIADGIHLFVTPGHTPGSQSVQIGSGGDSVVVSGDVANHPMQIRYPQHRSFSDDDPAVAEATRRTLLESAERDGAILGPAHLPEPFGRIVDGRWQPVAP
jgi:glyoxylase-like metal-dependent hydrolase (beta-lactamase superfamily II)